jgi:hypothetical protein
MQQITATSQIEAGATIQRMEDGETRKVAHVEYDGDGIVRIELANVDGLYGDRDVIGADQLNGWVIL